MISSPKTYTSFDSRRKSVENFEFPIADTVPEYNNHGNDLSMASNESSFVDDGNYRATIYTTNYPKNNRIRIQSVEAR